jgi:iron(III) transport system substrate-binding protein
MMKLIQSIKFSALLVLVSCSSNIEDNKTVTVYVSADEQIAREVFALFTNETGIEVAWVGDTEASKTTALVQRLKREILDPVADVFWSSEILGTIQLAQQNAFEPHLTEVASAWPSTNRHADFTWFAFSPRARVIAYDPMKTQLSELPETWWEYGGSAMADPRFGTTGTHIAVLSLYPDQFQEFIATRSTKPLLGGNAATVQAVIDGTVQFAMTDSDDVHAGIARGASLAMHYPKHHDGEGGGTLLIPNTVAIIRNCSHPRSASAFVDFLLSDQVAMLLAESPSHNIPLQPEVAKMYPSLQVENPLVVSFLQAEQAKEKAIQDVLKVHVNE